MNQKIELALCYNLAHKYKLSDMIFGHISIRHDNGFYIKEPMMPFENVAPENLRFVDLDSDIKRFGDFGIHASIYKNTKHQSIMHVHTDAICAMACSKEKLLNISQPSALVNTSFIEYEYESNFLFDSDYSNLINLIKEYEFILMRNHGFITAGKSLQHVFFNSYMFDKACRIQLLSRNQTEFNHELMTRSRELKFLLKYHQSEKEIWKNLLGEAWNLNY
jgi:ribulose-5-phosphate 4-epimerase/fuculose-1-phosphate aldolase